MISVRVPEHVKREWWDFWTHDEQKSWRLHGVTSKDVERLNPKVWKDVDFWWHCLARFNHDMVPPRTLRERNKNSFECATSTFWAMIREKTRL